MDLSSAAGRASHQRALEGWMNDLPPEESSVVKVFFSSTFTDMSVERNWLMKEAVPYLRDYCKERGLDYQVVDMRWGVREDSSVEHTTTDLCLQQVVSCQQHSAGPYFVAFLGDRYGSRLLPTTIPVTEYRSLRRLASWMDQSDFGVVDKWYLVDTNAVPAVYRIQPITALCPHYNDPDPKNRIIKQQHQQTWHRDQTKMMKVFRVVAAEAFQRKIISSEEYEKYCISVTHAEVNTGILKSPDTGTKNVNKVFCFHRRLEDIDITDKLAKRFVDLTEEGDVDEEAAELREGMKEAVTQHLDASHLSTYTIGWTDRGVSEENPHHAAYLKTFSDTFTAHMIHAIDSAIAGQKESASGYGQDLYREVITHLRFCRDRCQVFCGRERELHKIQNLLDKARGCGQGAGGMEGEGERDSREAKQGAGGGREEEKPANDDDKQTLMDMCKITGATFSYGDAANDFESDPSRDLQEEQVTMPPVLEHKQPVIVHGPSGSGKSALMAKVAQLSKRWVPGSVCVVRFLGTTPSSSNIRDTLVSVITQVLKLYNLQPPPGLDLGVDYHYLVLYFRALLWRINSRATPLFLLLDSVDQLLSADYAHLLTWLPKLVPPNVYLLVSMATDHPECLANAREHLPSKDQFVSLGRMDRGVGDKVVRALCHQAGRTLTAAQRTLVLDTYNTSQALHLKLLTEQAMSWRSHHKVAHLKLSGSVEGAIEQLFEELEKSHGEILVSRALGYLTLGRVGVGDGEMEDLLSLDDQVLQDTFLYHLPPDPHLIRFPSSLWVRLKSDIHAYLATGEKSVNTWFHRHFREAALRRYAAEEDVAAELHGAMADYFLGSWSLRPKPLELYKGKTASYEDCVRGLPAQPLFFQGGVKKVFNLRKLQELPYHLACSDRWDDFHANVACNADWLVASCHVLGVTALLAQFKVMLARSTDDLEDAEVKQKVKDIMLVQSIIKLGVDDIRRDPVSVPLQILGQLGPQYVGSKGMEDLVRQCRHHLTSSPLPLFLPHNAFLPAPGGLLLSSVSAQLFVMGSDRKRTPGICLDKAKSCLHVVEWSSGNKPDNLLIMDYENAGVIIAREKLPFHIHSYQLISKHRFYMFTVYTRLSKYQPEFEYVLYEGNLVTPYLFDKRVVAMSVASHGQLIAYALQDDKTVHLGTPDSQARRVLTKQHIMMDHPISTLLFSPDASHLVAVDRHGNISCYNVSRRQAMSLHTNTERQFGFNTPSADHYHITRSNLLLRVVDTVQEGHSLSVMDLVTRQEKHRLCSDRLQYSFSLVEMDDEEEFVIVCNTDTSVVNGNRERPALMWRLRDGELATVVESQNSWQALKLIGQDSAIYCLASCSNVGIIQILSCGPRESPEREATLLCELKDHSKSVTALVPVMNNSVLVSGAEDNTIKFWDLARILREKRLKEEEGRGLRRGRKRRKVKEEEEEQTGVELLGKTTALAVTGTSVQRAYFGTDKGVVGYSQLEDSNHRGVQLVPVTSNLPPVHLLLLSRTEDYLMAAARNVVVVIDAQEGSVLYQVSGLNGEQRISCLAEGGYTAALGHGGMEGKVKLWDLKSGDFIKELSFLYSFQYTAINRSGTQVVASMFEYPIVMNVYGTGEEAMAGGSNLRMDKLDTLMTGLTFICISPNDKLVAACASNGSTRVVSLDNVYLHRLQQRSTATCALFTADSGQLLTGGYRSVYVWTMGSGTLDFKLTRHQDFVTCLRFALDGRFLLTSSLDRTVAVWDWAARVTVSVVRTPCQLQAVHVLPDLSRLVYVPGRLANMAVMEPNPALQGVLAQGRRLADISEPETLEHASAFAASFNTQKDVSRNTSAACVIL
ncbi:uncharacterized protein LOC143294026 [Babylonia areolata]|uniref:uncharacterized protein LOC143294026 n=1 Tax=Babylonia areolata TaxID=304850 RepID=UPI003FCEFF52